MDPITPLIKPAIDLILSGLGFARKQMSKRKYEELLSAIIAELIKEHPDISFAEAKLAAAEATGVEPSMELLRAKSMLEAARGYHAQKPTKAPAARAKWAAAKKAPAKKRPAKKPASKRRSKAAAKGFSKR